MDFAFGTVIYPAGQKYLPEFVNSLCSQTDKEFQLLVVNDGCNIKNLDFRNLNYTLLKAGESIAENRNILINEATKRDFKWIIFGDSDDLFENNRVETIKIYSDEYDLISNDIIPFRKNKIFYPKFRNVLGDFSVINKKFIRDKNIFGFSNSACKINFLNYYIPPEIIAVDWFLFTRAIQGGAKACFTSETNTFYRQWERNIIGLSDISSNQIRTGIKAKYFHYRFMLNIDNWYSEEFKWIKNLYQNLDNQIDVYTNLIKKQGESSSFWWENIKNCRL